jgi:hypothetical protein
MRQTESDELLVSRRKRLKGRFGSDSNSDHCSAAQLMG